MAKDAKVYVEIANNGKWARQVLVDMGDHYLVFNNNGTFRVPKDHPDLPDLKNLVPLDKALKHQGNALPWSWY